MGYVVGVSFRLPDWEEVVDETFLIQLEEVWCSQALMLVRNYNHLDVFWRDNTGGHRQSACKNPMGYGPGEKRGPR